MKPWPKLQRMAVSEWVAISGVSLHANLNLLLKAEVSGKRELPREILYEAWHWIQCLSVQYRCGQYEQRYYGRAQPVFASRTPLVRRHHCGTVIHSSRRRRNFVHFGRNHRQ
jgi:hypothetical protein